MRIRKIKQAKRRRAMRVMMIFAGVFLLGVAVGSAACFLIVSETGGFACI